VNALSKCVEGLEPYDENWVFRNVVCAEPVEACFFSECEICCNHLKVSNLELPDDAEETEIDVVIWRKSHNERLGAYQFVKSSLRQTVRSHFDVCLCI
jgi:hypothetical protein